MELIWLGLIRWGYDFQIGLHLAVDKNNSIIVKWHEQQNEYIPNVKSTYWLWILKWSLLADRSSCRILCWHKNGRVYRFFPANFFSNWSKHFVTTHAKIKFLKYGRSGSNPLIFIWTICSMLPLKMLEAVDLLHRISNSRFPNLHCRLRPNQAKSR